MNSRTAIVTGIRGQDGAYLASLLLQKGYRVIGADRRSGGDSRWRLEKLGIERDVEYVHMDLLEYSNIEQVIRTYQPNEFYNLAAQSHVGVSFEQPLLTAEVDGIGVLRILEAIRRYSPTTRFYQASTSELMGLVQEIPQRESTPFYPRSPYGVAKLYAHWITINYRESYNLHASCGILYNHESPLRGSEFVTRKITKGIVSIMNGTQKCIELGNLDAKRDWGFAGDYVEAMHAMLQMDTPDDYIIATGEQYSVREFVELAFSHANMKICWEGKGREEIGLDERGNTVVRINPTFYRPAEVESLLGDATKARTVLGWKPKFSFNDLVHLMMSEALYGEKAPN